MKELESNALSGLFVQYVEATLRARVTDVVGRIDDALRAGQLRDRLLLELGCQRDRDPITLCDQRVRQCGLDRCVRLAFAEYAEKVLSGTCRADLLGSDQRKDSK